MEDCAFLLESLGFDTGIDVNQLIQLRSLVQTWLPGEKFCGTVARAGLPKVFRPARRAVPSGYLI
jgi:hydroxymethylglutaryl-CoA lyase